MKELENIDDDCNRHDIQFVKTDDRKAMKEYGIDDTPRLVYFENRVPNVYDGTLTIVAVQHISSIIMTTKFLRLVNLFTQATFAMRMKY